MVTVVQAVKDFNRWMANNHAHQGRSGASFTRNFTHITAIIDEFRLAYYHSKPATEIPEVSEIEAAVRKAWGLKAAGTRKKRAIAEAQRAALAEQKDKQYKLPF